MHAKNNALLLGIIFCCLFAAWYVPRRTIEANTVISAIVIPHHNLVAAQRQKFIEETFAGKQNPAGLIIISPNHYDVGDNLVQLADRDWETSAGILPNNISLRDALVTDSAVKISNPPFQNEHGIRNVLQDLRSQFGEIPTSAIILNSKTPQIKIDALSESLHAHCPNCMVVASVDFSHYQPSFTSKLHDINTEQILTSNAYSRFDEMEVDSWQALYVAARFSALAGAGNFHKNLRTSSNEMAQTPLAEGTTHIFGMWSNRLATSVETNTSVTIAKLAAPLGIDRPDHLSFRSIFGTSSSLLVSEYLAAKPTVHRSEQTIQENGVFSTHNASINPPKNTLSVLFLSDGQGEADADAAFSKGYSIVIGNEAIAKWKQQDNQLYLSSLQMGDNTIQVVASMEQGRLTAIPYFFKTFNGETLLERDATIDASLRELIGSPALVTP